MAATLAASAKAEAKSVVEGQLPVSQAVSRPITPLPKADLIADNVVVTPTGAQPAAQPTTAVVAPQTVQPVAQPTPVVEEPAHRSEVRAEVASPRNYMSTIALSALMGAVAGGLVGGAVYYLGSQQNWHNVAYWAAGGVLVGTGVGIVQVMVQENRVGEAAAWRNLPTDPAPTYRLALMGLRF